MDIKKIDGIQSTQDTLETKSIEETNGSNIAQTDTSKTEMLKPDTKQKKEDKTPAEYLSNNFSFLRPILMPIEYTYSGLGTIINTMFFIRIFSIVISILLLILSLLVKFIENKARKTIVLLDALAFVFLVIAIPATLGYEILWGFWVAVIFSLALTLYDFYILKLEETIEKKK